VPKAVAALVATFIGKLDPARNGYVFPLIALMAQSHTQHRWMVPVFRETILKFGCSPIMEQFPLALRGDLKL
jgi:hypothetical protein